MGREVLFLRQDTANWVDDVIAFDAEDRALNGQQDILAARRESRLYYCFSYERCA